MLCQVAADVEMDDAEHAFSEGLKGFINAAAASVNAATVLQRDTKALCDLFAKERLKLRDQKLQLEAERASLLGSPIGPSVHSQAPDSARARAFERELGALRLGADSLQNWEPLAEAFQATANVFKPINVFAPLRTDALEADGTERFLRPMTTDDADPSYYEDLNNAVRIGLRSYTVLPPHSKDSTKPSHSMCNQTYVVPDGWEVLSTEMDDFDQVIRSLSEHGWGTLRLCVHDVEANAFACYGTSLRHFGVPGEKLSGDTDVLIPEQDNPRKFSFKKVSGRLVIRSDRLWHGWR